MICLSDSMKTEDSPNGGRESDELVAGDVEVLQTHQLADVGWKELQVVGLQVQHT